MRKFDDIMINRFGKRYLPFIWFRSFLVSGLKKKIHLIYPISVANREHDELLKKAFNGNLSLLEAKKPLPSYFGGCNYIGGDLEIYDLMLQTYKPNNIIEIGSGGSTQFAYYKTHLTKITSIDPEPRTVIPRGLNSRMKIIEKKCEEVDVSIFDDLEENDILFIDSSHLKEEAEYHVNKILPRLKSGVIIHHHDIYYPYDIHPDWEEQRVILDFYAQNTEQFEIIMPSAFTYYYNNWTYRTKINLSKNLPAYVVPCSLWVKKK